MRQNAGGRGSLSKRSSDAKSLLSCTSHTRFSVGSFSSLFASILIVVVVVSDSKLRLCQSCFVLYAVTVNDTGTILGTVSLEKGTTRKIVNRYLQKGFTIIGQRLLMSSSIQIGIVFLSNNAQEYCVSSGLDFLIGCLMSYHMIYVRNNSNENVELRPTY